MKKIKIGLLALAVSLSFGAFASSKIISEGQPAPVIEGPKVVQNQVSTNNAIDNENLVKRIRKLFIVSDFMIDTPYEYAGYLLFKKDIENEVCKLKKPGALYLLDHEGGTVNRIKSPLIGANAVTNENMDDYLHQWNKDLTVIKEKCINVILGPTADVNFGSRSYSKSLNNNLTITQPIVNSIERKGMLPVLKHFPGEMMDCKEKFARKEVRLCPQGINEINEQWKDFKGKGDNYPAIMMSNYIYEGFSPLPAVMDEKMYKYLRNTLNYNGVIMTDALWEMSVPITPNTIWEIFKYADLILLIDPEQVEKIVPYLAKRMLETPNGTMMLEAKEARIAKARMLIK